MMIYSIVPNACSSLNIFVGNSTFDSSMPELAVSQWPNLRPTFNNIQYTSYDWGYQNLTIDTFDPNFFGIYSYHSLYTTTTST